MKRLFLILIIFSATITSQVKQELRAVWITNVDSPVMFSDDNIANAMKFLADRGFNLVFPVVWNKGYTLYPSRIMDSLFQVPIWQNFAGRDPLKKMVLEAHKHGMEIVPWFEFGFSPSYSLNGGHIVAKFPGWALKNNAGQLVVKNGFDWLSGINPEVQNFMISLVTEVLDNYDVDGVQGDDRLPAMPVEGGYDSATVAVYKSENNNNNPPGNFYDAAWKRWRANKLSQFFSRMKDSVKARGDYYLISSAPSVYPWGYDNYLQDSKTWVDSGIAENFIPQLYRDTYFAYINEFNNSYNQVAPSKRNRFFAGILSKSGSYVISADYLVKAVQYNRQNNVNGECYFFYESFPLNNNALGDTLKSRFYGEPALLPYRNGNVFRPKAKIINEDSVANTSRTGNWERVQVQGYNPGLYWTKDTAYAQFDWYMDIENDAWYDIYMFLIPNFSFSSTAKYKLYSQNSTDSVIINLRESSNSKWVKLGSVYLTKGRRKVVSLDNTIPDAGKYIVADAAMTMLNRKKSPDVIITSVEKDEDEERDSGNSNSDFAIYPNPASAEYGAINLSFYLESPASVKIEIFNLLGEKVLYQEEGEKTAGRQKSSVSITKNRLAPGVYFCKVSAGNWNRAGKMVIMR